MREAHATPGRPVGGWGGAVGGELFQRVLDHYRPRELAHRSEVHGAVRAVARELRVEGWSAWQARACVPAIAASYGMRKDVVAVLVEWAFECSGYLDRLLIDSLVARWPDARWQVYAAHLEICRRHGSRELVYGASARTIALEAGCGSGRALAHTRDLEELGLLEEAGRRPDGTLKWRLSSGRPPSRSAAEWRAAVELTRLGVRHVHHARVVAGGHEHVVDLLCPGLGAGGGLVIEGDGAVHEGREDKDADRRRRLEEASFTVASVDGDEDVEKGVRKAVEQARLIGDRGVVEGRDIPDTGPTPCRNPWTVDAALRLPNRHDAHERGALRSARRYLLLVALAGPMTIAELADLVPPATTQRASRRRTARRNVQRLCDAGLVSLEGELVTATLGDMLGKLDVAARAAVKVGAGRSREARFADERAAHRRRLAGRASPTQAVPEMAHMRSLNRDSTPAQQATPAHDGRGRAAQADDSVEPPVTAGAARMLALRRVEEPDRANARDAPPGAESAHTASRAKIQAMRAVGAGAGVRGDGVGYMGAADARDLLAFAGEWVEGLPADAGDDDAVDLAERLIVHCAALVARPEDADPDDLSAAQVVDAHVRRRGLRARPSFRRYRAELEAVA